MFVDYTVPTDAGSYMVTLELFPKDRRIELQEIVGADGDTSVDLEHIYMLLPDGKMKSLERHAFDLACGEFFKYGGWENLDDNN